MIRQVAKGALITVAGWVGLLVWATRQIEAGNADVCGEEDDEAPAAHDWGCERQDHVFTSCRCSERDATRREVRQYIARHESDGAA